MKCKNQVQYLILPDLSHVKLSHTKIWKILVMNWKKQLKWYFIDRAPVSNGKRTQGKDISERTKEKDDNELDWWDVVFGKAICEREEEIKFEVTEGIQVIIGYRQLQML